MPDSLKPFTVNRRHLIILGLIVVSLYIILPQFGGFRSSLSLLRDLEIAWAVIAFIAVTTSYVFAAYTYYCLAFYKLPIKRLFTVQLAAMFVNRLVPAGIGAVSVNYLFLKKQRHTNTQAVSVAASNNLLGLVGHALLLGVATAYYRPDVSLDVNAWVMRWPYLIVAVLIITTLLRFTGPRLKVFFTQLRRDLASYKKRPHRLLFALLSSVSLTICMVVSVYATAMALGIQLEPLTALLVLSAGVGAGAATPTPGGLGGFEAGIVAALMSNDVAAAPALAVALLYRLISYWVPLAFGR